MSESQALPVPTVSEFRNAVTRELRDQGRTTVQGLCSSQTQTVINDLADYYHGESDQILSLPSVEVFCQAIEDFQQQKARPTFADLRDPEVGELINKLAPHFHEVITEEEEQQEEANEANGTEETDEDSLEGHPF